MVAPVPRGCEQRRAGLLIQDLQALEKAHITPDKLIGFCYWYKQLDLGNIIRHIKSRNLLGLSDWFIFSVV